jgi:hypothetical protein
MAIFSKPDNLNGAQLRKELKAVGVTFTDEFETILINAENELVLEIKKTDEQKAKQIIENHNGIDIDLVKVKESAQAKFAALGLTEEEVASILG